MTRPITTLDIGRAFRVPMSLIDGRPWVPTLEEMPEGDE